MQVSRFVLGNFSNVVKESFVQRDSIMGIPLGRVADKYNRRNLIVAGMSLWCLMTAASGLARNFVQLFLARLGTGVGEAALSPAANPSEFRTVAGQP